MKWRNVSDGEEIEVQLNGPVFAFLPIKALQAKSDELMMRLLTLTETTSSITLSISTSREFTVTVL